MRFAFPAAVLAVLLLPAAPAHADAPGPAYGPRHHAQRHVVVRSRVAARRRQHGGYRGVAPEPAYGPLPPLYEGMGHAAAHIDEDGPVALTTYREAYIARGLIYNTPPTLDVPSSVISVRY